MGMLCLGAARRASEAIGAKPPEHLIVHSPDVDLLILALHAAEDCLIAQIKPEANLGLALAVLRSLGERLTQALRH